MTRNAKLCRTHQILTPPPGQFQHFRCVARVFVVGCVNKPQIDRFITLSSSVCMNDDRNNDFVTQHFCLPGTEFHPFPVHQITLAFIAASFIRHFSFCAHFAFFLSSSSRLSSSFPHRSCVARVQPPNDNILNNVDKAGYCFMDFHIYCESSEG